ncbi:hypothetical protein LJC20_05120 [Eubacteriales bacterium OttesenSCG-928-M02]|nr:hypothetical protein [Eubacteriales bacterium OttesenSCG-928-M02]
MKKTRDIVPIVMIALLLTTILLPVPAFAESLDDTVFGQGIKNLINDVVRWLQILAPVLGGVLLIYFFIRKAAADEMDAKKYNQRISTTLICVVAVEVTTVVVNLIVGYFQ